jgi:hypothetical protein
MKKLILTLVVLSLPAFASEHFIGRTLEPAAKLAYFPVHYVARHPLKTVKGAAKGVAVTAKAVF